MAVEVPNVRRRSTEMKKDLQQICADFNSLTLTMYNVHGRHRFYYEKPLIILYIALKRREFCCTLLS